MPKATPINRVKKSLPNIPDEKKIIKFELNYNNTKILIESDNEETLINVFDIIRGICSDKDNAPIRKLLDEKI